MTRGDNSIVIETPGTGREWNRGISLIEVGVTVAILSLLIAGTTTLFSIPFDFEKEQKTIRRLIGLKHAIIGDSRVVTREARTDFGFLGDTGSFPTTLDDLWILGSHPLYVFDTSLKMGLGWSGPYVRVPTLGFFDDIRLDAWGTEIQYVVATEVSSSTGQTMRAKLISYGPDTSEGGGDDLTVEIYETEMLSRVTGFVLDAVGNPLPGVTATMSYPVFSVTSSTTIQTDSNGAFTFTDITFGSRSLIIQPNMVYLEDTAVSTGGQSNDMEFVIQNFSSTDATFDSFTMVHDSGAFFERVRIGNSYVFTNTSDRVGTGETVSFATQTVTGSGSITGRTLPVRIQSSFILAPDQSVGVAATKGGALRIQVEDWEDAETGSSSPVDMTGISFEVTFSDGSVAIFTTVRE